MQPTGLVGSIAGFRDLAVFEGAAQRARQLGCEGAGCIHPDQVTVLNRVFTPDPAKVEHARRVVEAFEDGVRRGTASVNLDGKMVDVPVYKRAQVILARADRRGRDRASQGRRAEEKRMTPVTPHQRRLRPPARVRSPTTRARSASGDTVLQSGTTAIDRQGNVRGEGDVARQVDAIMKIAEWSMGKAGGRLDDVVRSRIYVTDIARGRRRGPRRRALLRRRPPGLHAGAGQWPGPAQPADRDRDRRRRRRTRLGASASPPAARWRRSTRTRGRVRVGDRVFISGSTALKAGGVEGPGDMYRQTRATMDTILRALADAGGVPGDLVYTKTFLTDLGKSADYTRAFVEALGDVRPVSTLLGMPGARAPRAAGRDRGGGRAGRRRARAATSTPSTSGRSRAATRARSPWATSVYVSGCTSISSAGEVQAAGDWARQYDLAMDTIGWALGQAGAALEDVVRRRTFTVEGAKQNRAHGEGPTPFAKSHPTSLGCRISGLARPELVVEVEVTAVKGAGAGIQWIGPDAVDPLDAS